MRRRNERSPALPLARSGARRRRRVLPLVPVLVLLAAAAPAGARAQLPTAELSADEPCFSLRYNPGDCDCAQFELRQGALWSRVFLRDRSDEGDLVNSLRKQARRPGQEVRQWEVVATVLDKVQRCSLGHPHLVVEVLGVCPARAPAASAPLDEPASPEAEPAPREDASAPGAEPPATPAADSGAQRPGPPAAAADEAPAAPPGAAPADTGDSADVTRPSGPPPSGDPAAPAPRPTNEPAGRE